MPFYLAPYIGAGTRDDPFRPRGSDQPGWSAIDLRPDASRLDGGGLSACLLYLPQPSLDSRLDLVALDPADTIGSVLRSTLVSRLKLIDTPLSSRWDDLAMELLLGPPPGGWNALRASMNGSYEIYLGGTLKRIPGISGGLQENWGCPNSSSINCQLTWTESADVFSILSNAVRVTGTTAYAWARADADLASTDHYAQVTIVNQTSVDFNEGGPIIRKDSTSTATFYTAMFGHSTSFGIDRHELEKFVSGTNTLLGSVDTTNTFSAGEVLKVQANGSTISAFKNGGALTMSPQTDTSITTGTRAGIIANVDTTTGSGMFIDYDDFAAQDLAGWGRLLSLANNRLIGAAI